MSWTVRLCQLVGGEIVWLEEFDSIPTKAAAIKKGRAMLNKMTKDNAHRPDVDSFTLDIR